MKTLLLLLLKGYQVILSPLLHQLMGQSTMCRYEITCSAYAKDVIIKHGAFKGSMLALKRFFSCQPFVKPYANI